MYAYSFQMGQNIPRHFTIYAPDMAFTLISTDDLDDAKCSVIFSKGMCTIKDPKAHTMATVPWADGLYCLANPNEANPYDHANVAVGKMSICEAHWRFGHISHTAIKHAISSGQITWIDLDMESNPDFCKPYAKVKLTWATEYSDCIHWDL